MKSNIQIDFDDKKINFLYIDDVFNYSGKKNVYIFHYPNNKLLISFATIQEFTTNGQFTHNCITEYGSSGGPIFNSSTEKVIGMHLGRVRFKDINAGINLIEPIEEFQKKYHHLESENIKQNRYTETEKGNCNEDTNAEKNNDDDDLNLGVTKTVNNEKQKDSIDKKLSMKDGNSIKQSNAIIDNNNLNKKEDEKSNINQNKEENKSNQKDLKIIEFKNGKNDKNNKNSIVDKKNNNQNNNSKIKASNNGGNEVTCCDEVTSCCFIF